MCTNNHRLAFRPLRGGIEIYNPNVGEPGTLGFIAEAAAEGSEKWLVSSYHVLIGGPRSAPVHGQGVEQPCYSEPIAVIDATRADVYLDCAAAKIRNGVSACREILGIGNTGLPADPKPGQRVIKSGATTGVTEGIIDEVDGEDVVIALLPSFDPNYLVSNRGDSGALWLTRDGLAPVALHTGEVGDARKRVRAKAIWPVLAVLRLQICRNGHQ